MQTGIARGNTAAAGRQRSDPGSLSRGRSRSHRSDLSVKNSQSGECRWAGGVGDLDLALVAALATGGQQQPDK